MALLRFAVCFAAVPTFFNGAFVHVSFIIVRDEDGLDRREEDEHDEADHREAAKDDEHRIPA